MPTSSRAGEVYSHDPVEWGNVIYDPIPPPHSMHCGGSVRLRDDVGIVPYDLLELRAIQRGRNS